MKMKFVVIVTLTAVIMLSLVACGGADSDSVEDSSHELETEPPADSIEDSVGNDPLDGTSWVLMAYRKTKPIPGTTITATFEDGRVHGSASCNSYSASYQVSGDTITIGAIALTMMVCPEPEGIMEQETVFLEFMQDALTFRFIDGQLQIFRSDGEALTFIPPE